MSFGYADEEIGLTECFGIELVGIFLPDDLHRADLQTGTVLVEVGDDAAVVRRVEVAVHVDEFRLHPFGDRPGHRSVFDRLCLRKVFCGALFHPGHFHGPEIFVHALVGHIIQGQRCDIPFRFVRKPVQRLESAFGDHVGVAACYVRGDEGNLVLFGEFDDRRVVGLVVGPELGLRR